MAEWDSRWDIGSFYRGSLNGVCRRHVSLLFGENAPFVHS